MNRNEPDLDRLTDISDPATMRLTSDLHRLCSTTIPPAVRAGIAQTLSVANAEAQKVPTAHPLIALAPRLAMRRVSTKWMVSVAAALLLVLGGGAGVLRLASPGTASAAEILRRAAVAVVNVGANQVVHEITVAHVGAQPTGAPAVGDITSEQWTQVDGSGNPLQIDLSHTNADSTPFERLVADDQGNVWTYTPGQSTVEKSIWTPGQPFFRPPPASDPMAILYLAKQTVNAPQDPSAIHDLLQSAADGNDGQVKLLDEQTIGETRVDVVQISRSVASAGAGSAPNVTTEVVTVFIDPSTYLMCRIEMSGLNGQGAVVDDETVDVTKYEVMSPGDVPAGTFTFTPPAGVQIVDLSSTCPNDPSTPSGKTGAPGQNRTGRISHRGQAQTPPCPAGLKP
jgi:hypothetical protein